MGVIILLIGVLWVAATAFTVGWRGRAIDDHPLCRKCGFDLTGLPATSTRCSECGADLTRPRAVVIGHRQRRPQFLALGSILLLGALVGGGVEGWISFSKFNFDSYKPFWWLKHDLLAGGSASSDAMLELMIRDSNSKLTNQQIDWIADTLLAWQVTPTLWTTAYGTFLETVHWRGELDRGRWGRYLQQSFILQLRVRHNVLQGEQIPVELHARPWVLENAAFAAFFEWIDVAIDGKSIPRKQWANWSHNKWHDGLYRSNGGDFDEGCLPPQFDGEMSRRLGLGSHHLSIIAEMNLYSDQDVTGDFDDAKPVPGALRLAKSTTTLGADFNIVDAAHDATPVVTDPHLRDAVRAAITVESVVAANSYSSSVDLDLDRPPVRLHFEVFVRDPDSGDQWKANMRPSANGAENASIQGWIDHPLTRLARVDIILKPALAAARQSVDDSPIWGEPIVFHDIPVQHPAPAGPTQ